MNQRGCKAVGIDLGTTYSALAHVDAQNIPRIIPDREGKPVTPSVVYFDEQGIPVVGDVALDKAIVHSERAVQFVKVHMGDVWQFPIRSQVHTPESISALILAHLVREAEPQIGQPIRQAVITVPAFFTEKRRRATQQAGEIAGLKVLGTLHEPVAAALAYGMHRMTDRKEKNILIYDLGGGTFDVTVVRITAQKMEELAICGNRQLGGKDWDQCLIDLMIREFQSQHRIDLNALVRQKQPEALQAMQDLQIACERAKRHLSSLSKTDIKLQALGRSCSRTVTRDEFKQLTAHLVNLTKLTTNQAVKDAGFTTGDGRPDWSRIDKVVLVGGSTQMPTVREMLQQISGKPPDIGINPVTAVALGAAVYAQILETGQGPIEVPTEATPRPGAVPAPQPATPRPGAAPAPPPRPAPAPIQLPVRFVTAHGVGVRIRRQGVHVNDVLIHKNTAVPVRTVRRYRAVKKNEAQVADRLSIVVTQGDTPDADTAEVLGTAVITGIPKDEPEGQPVDVTLAFDQQGRLQLQAVFTKRDNTRQQLQLDLDVPGGLRQEQVQKLRQQLQASGLVSKVGIDPTIDDLPIDDLPVLEEIDSDDDLPFVEPLG
jgi:molecular chaperone DnaK